jgi:hypothetical protein
MTVYSPSGVCVGRSWSFQSTSLGTIPMPIGLTHHGVGIPLGLGIDYRVLPFLAVGPSFQYEIVVPVAGCMTTSPNQAGVIGASVSLPDEGSFRL